MTNISALYEIKIQHLDGLIFSLSDYYDDGIMMSLIGFKKLNQGAYVYTNVNTPKLFNPRTWNILDYNKRYKFII